MGRALSVSESHQEELSRRKGERKAAVDIGIIITAFLLCFLPGFIVWLFQQLGKSIKVPANVVLITNCIFTASSTCNPVIYSTPLEVG